MIIRARNLLDQSAQYTYLSDSSTEGDTDIYVKNINSFNENQAIQLGKTGEEQSEILVLGTEAPTGVVLNCTTELLYDHPIDTPVYAIKYDQLIFKCSTLGTAGTADSLTDGTVPITPDSLYTDFDDVAGTTSCAYKTQYYNSVTEEVSLESDWITSSGYDFYSLASMRERMKNKLLNAGFIGDDSVIHDWINEYMEVLTNKVIDVNQDYNLGSTNVAFAAGVELGTITPADFKQVRRVWYTEAAGVTYTMTKMELTTPRPDQVFTETQPYFFMYDSNVMGRWPHTNAGTCNVLYYRLTPVLVNETDILPTPMRGYTKGFVDYALAQAYRKDSKPDMANTLEASAIAQAEIFKKEMTPRSKSGPQMIDIVESCGEDGVDFYYRV
jgi:hypothetical protein